MSFGIIAIDPSHFSKIGAHRKGHARQPKSPEKKADARKEERVSYGSPVFMKEVALKKWDCKNSVDSEPNPKSDRPSTKFAQSLFRLPVDH